MALLPSIGCYVRLSVHADDAEVQRSGMTHWLREQQIAPVTTQWFEDVDHAEATDYPAYEALHAAILTGRINTVVVWSFACLFLRLKDAVNILAIWCGRGHPAQDATSSATDHGSSGRFPARPRVQGEMTETLRLSALEAGPRPDP